MVDASRQVGLETANPALIRSALDLWYFDSSAKAMGEEHRGRTRLLFTAKKLNDLYIYDRLQPGDIAVTENGVHTLAYKGNRTWIEADPGDWKVIEVTAPSSNIWFNTPVKLLRWSQLT